jgi:hypothetical protein
MRILRVFGLTTTAAALALVVTAAAAIGSSQPADAAMRASYNQCAALINAYRTGKHSGNKAALKAAYNECIRRVGAYYGVTSHGETERHKVWQKRYGKASYLRYRHERQQVYKRRAQTYAHAAGVLEHMSGYPHRYSKGYGRSLQRQAHHARGRVYSRSRTHH